MKLREPFTMFLGFILLAGAVSWHVDSKEKDKAHKLDIHYLQNHKEAYNAEAELRLKQKEELRKAEQYKYGLKEI